jgi:glycosyltransferase involved in cell wall biosynthesis
MRIVHYLKWMRLTDGGTVRAVLDWCEALATRGHEVTLLTADDMDVPVAWKKGGAHLPRVIKLELRDLFKGAVLEGSPDTPFQLLTRQSLMIAKSVIKEAHCLHLHGVWATSNLQLASLAYKLHTPYVVSPHGMLDNWSVSQSALKKKVHLSLFGNRMLRRAGAVLCTAEGEANQARAHFQHNKAKVLPLLFDIDPFRTPADPRHAIQTFNLEPQRHRVLFLSRLSPKKGADRLLRAAALLSDINADFILAGPADSDEYESELKQLARELNVEGAVRFVGMVRGDDKYALFRAADVFVLPTSQENWGFVILEAMASGVPVITTKGVDIWPELQRSGGARIVETDVETLATAIRSLLEDRTLRLTMGQAGREWVRTTFDRENILSSYENLYQSLAH